MKRRPNGVSAYSTSIGGRSPRTVRLTMPLPRLETHRGIPTAALTRAEKL